MFEERAPLSSPGTPLLLQKASKLAISIALLASSHGAMFNAYSVASVPTSRRAIYLSCTGSDFATATVDDVKADSTAALDAASRELEIAKRVLVTLRDDLDHDAVGYLDRLHDIFQFAEENKEALSQVVDRIAAHLSSARMQLLEDAQTARRWVRLARAIDPDAQLRLPKRFVRAPVRPTTDIDPDAFEAAAWARSVIA